MTNISDQQQRDLSLQRFLNKQNTFITGGGGVGKSKHIELLCNQTPNRKIVILASTGVAAVNISSSFPSMTIHSFFEISPSLAGAYDEMTAFFPDQRYVDKIVPYETIIIDEASLVTANLLSCINRRLQIVMNNSLPFGGKHILLVGDPFQLEAILPRQEKNEDGRLLDEEPLQFFFQSPSWQRADFQTIELTHVFRQDNQVLINLLNKVRKGFLPEGKKDVIKQIHHFISEINEVLKSCINRFSETDPTVTYLALRREQVNKINQAFYDQLDEEEHVITGSLLGRGYQLGEFPVSYFLKLKKGLRVMTVANNFPHYYNGQLGHIHDITPQGNVFVKFDNGNLQHIKAKEWKRDEYCATEQSYYSKSQFDSCLKQLPIVPAYSYTVHKSQGLTLEKLHINLDGRPFAAGQLYVALSRCKSLEGLSISRELHLGDFMTNTNVHKFYSQACSKTA